MIEPSDSSDITLLDPTTALTRPGKNTFRIYGCALLICCNERLSAKKTSLEFVYAGLVLI